MKMNTFLVILALMIIAFGSYLLWYATQRGARNDKNELALKIDTTARDTQDTVKDVGKNISDQIQLRDPEHGTWDPSVHYITGDSRNGYAQEISVDVKDYQYQRDQEIAKINFDFSVDLKQVPRGSTLTIDGAPFTIENGKLTEFTINQTGLNHSGEVMVSAKPNTTRFVVMVNTEGVQKAYVTDGSEGSVRFRGYIVYKCGYYPP
jgi:predicted RNA-binding protein with TRAM domain